MNVIIREGKPMINENIFKYNVHKLLINIMLIMLVMIVMIVPAYGDEQQGNKTVRVGYYKSDGFQEGMSDEEIKAGYGYEYLQKVSYYAGWKYEYVYGEKSELYDDLQKGNIDIMAGVPLAQEENSTVLYPAYSMGSQYYYIYKRENDPTILKRNIDSLSGKRIGIVKENKVCDLLEEWKESKGADIEIIIFDSFADRDKAFYSGDIDCVVDRAERMGDSKAVLEVDDVGKIPFYLCVNVNRQDLMDELNIALERMLDLEPYYENNLYFDSENINASFYTDEIEWIQSHSVLKVGYLKDYLPYSDIDDDGNVTGIIKDIVPEMLEKMNIKDGLSVEYICYDSYEDMIVALNNKKIDTAFPGGGGMWYAEQSGIFLTSPVVTTAMNLAYKNSYTEESTNKIAVNRNNFMQYFYTRINFPNAEIVWAASLDGCLDKIMDGEAGSTVINGLRVENILKNIKYKGLSSIQLSKSDDRCFAVTAGNNALLGILNRGISDIGSEYGMNASHKYIGELYNYTMNDFIRDNVVIIGCVAGSIVILMMIVLIMRFRRLRKQAEKDRKIKAELKEALDTVQTTSDAMSAVYETLGAEKWSVDYTEDGKSEIVTFSDRYKESLGMKEKDVDIETVLRYIHPDDRKYVKDALDNMITDKTCETEYNVEYRQTTKDGKYVWVQSLGRPVLYKDDKHRIFYGIIIDISERKEKERIEYENAHIDTLTKLFNRNSFEEDVETLKCSDNVSELIAVTVDINRLKEVNDTIGHAAGDELIKGTAEVLNATFGKYGSCYRTGGDEFIVLIQDKDISTDEIKCEFDKNISGWSGNYVDKLSVSAGYARMKEFEHMDIDELIKISDKRMYQEKEKFYAENKIKRRIP